MTRALKVTRGSEGYTAVLGEDLDLFGHSTGRYSIRLVNPDQGDPSFGETNPIAGETTSLLGDGEITTTQGFGNEVLQLWVLIEANDHANLALGEARLMEELDRDNTLTWGGPVGPRSVFEIVRSWSDFSFEDLADARCWRLFRLSLEVLPDVRSEEPVTFTWSGPNRILSLAEAGWSQISPTGARLLENYTFGDSVGIRAGTGTTRLTVIETIAPVLVDGYFLHLCQTYTAGGQPDPRVWIGGELLPAATSWVQQRFGSSLVDQNVFDVSAWRGTMQTVRIEFTSPGSISASLSRLNRVVWSNYPNPACVVQEAGGSVRVPHGIDVLEIEGTARTGLQVEFDADGATLTPVYTAVYTGPDPLRALRERGAAEVGWGYADVSDPDGDVITYDGIDTYLPQGRTVGALFVTSGQPLVLNPDGVWPEYRHDTSTGAFFGYPESERAAVSLTRCTSPTPVTVLSPSIDAPSGLTDGGTFQAHEPHQLHPKRTGFAVIAQEAPVGIGKTYPVSCTVTYYPRWRHHAGL